ncbi:MAG: succinylglutamate desuccinylase/aspartoacylase family protein [Desulfobacterales bacterium]|nr:MAG: succinylglutamate desuccinylase/aspartoacylase family protein [Desulfobacterales bacterium]
MQVGLKQITAIAVLCLAVIVSMVTGRSFMSMWERDKIVPGPGVTKIKMLSEYFPALEGSAGDTAVYFLEGSEPGGTVSVMGGTHADEPSGWMSAILIVENAVVKKGRLIVVPQCNQSGFTHSYPQEAYPQRIDIATPHGVRSFRFGSRTANPIHFWPDPEVYVHYPSGQNLSGDEVRNLNRAYPGRPLGSFAERVAFGIKAVLLSEKVDLNVDLHEAPPEYPFINAIGAHERGKEIATLVAMELQAEKISIGLELSPPRFHGLTYRELGDFTPAICLLMETANPIQGRLRGVTDQELALQGQDDFYVQAARLGRTFVPFDLNGWPLRIRVGRHLSALLKIWTVFSDLNQDKAFVAENIPSLDELREKGIGYFLKAPP